MSGDAAFWESVFNSLSEGVVLGDGDQKVIIFNKAARRYFDPDLTRKKRRYWSRYFGVFKSDKKTIFPASQLPLMKAYKGISTNSVELFIRNTRVPEGAWISVSGRPIYDRAGRRQGAVTVFHDITSMKRAESQIVEISGGEQRRIGQELHDGLGQNLIASQLMLGALAAALESVRLPSGTAEILKDLRDNLRRSLMQTDDIARGLFPVELDRRGLMAALSEMARNMTRRYGLTCQFRCPKSVSIHNPALATHLFRITQEAVTNAIKSGKATRIEIRLSRFKNKVCIKVRDNGCGLPKRVNREGMGMHIMQYRARLINGMIQYQRPRSGGTRVICTAPTRPGIP
jgi:signal transduction histidine kinase